MVAITPLPDATPTVAGVVDNHGMIVPVIDLRCRCGLPQRAAEFPLQIEDKNYCIRSSPRRMLEILLSTYETAL